MSGFFSVGELTKTAVAEINIETLKPNCVKCKLRRNCRSPVMEISGEGKKKILVLGSAPSEADDENMIQFSGESGKYLREQLKLAGINLNRDCWKLNAINCHPAGQVEQKHIDCCRPYVERHIYTLKPDLIIALGAPAINSLFGQDFSSRKVDRWRDIVISDEKFKCKVYCTWTPAQVKFNKFDFNLKSCFERDIKNAVKALKVKRIDRVDYEQYVTTLTDFKAVEDVLKKVLRTKKDIYFDYETTGLKPYKAGHAIAYIGFAVSPTKAFVFPFENFWTNKEYERIKDLWRQILKTKSIKKIAHNIKFEDNWSSVHIGQRPIGWAWDTLMGAHILDNRKQYAGLKFQTFINYGIRPYDKHIKKYLEAEKGSDFNNVFNAPFNDITMYCGLDCIFGYMLFEKQKTELSGRKGLLNANAFFTKGLMIMAEIQLNGIAMDEEYYKRTRRELFIRIRKLKRLLVSSREGRAFQRKFGRKINVTSDQDIGLLIYEVLDKPPVYTGSINKKTGKYNYKTDKDTIGKFKLKWVDKLLEMKRLEKARGTYLAQFAREVFDGRMFPFFDLHIPVSYRSSSSKPNFQNLPKRDKEIKILVRRGIVPRVGNLFIEADFSGAEVITSVCYHKDQNFFNYLMDKSTDMHRDNAADLLMIKPIMLNDPSYSREQMLRAKDIRADVKNSWTFPQFYGDWYEACAKYMWEKWGDGTRLMPDGMPVVDHLAQNHVYSVEDFADHCKVCEDIMWNERFPDYTQWKKDIVKFYQKHGYIETYFGFRFRGYMDPKQCTNFPIQGTSFHLLVYTLIEVSRFIKRNKLQTKLIGQIHDSIIADAPVEEAQFYLQGVNKIVSSLQERFKWLIVPMEIEAEISLPRSLDGSLAAMYEVPNEMFNKINYKKVYDDAITKAQYEKHFKR